MTDPTLQERQMADVGVIAGGRKFVWTFPGDDPALVEAFRNGHFPRHLHPEWVGPPIACEGELREVERTPVLDRLIEVWCHRPEIDDDDDDDDELVSVPRVRAQLLTLEDDLTWRGSGAGPSSSAGVAPVVSLLGALPTWRGVCRYRASGASLLSLAPSRDMPEAALVDVLTHPSAAALEVLDLSALPGVTPAVWTAIGSRARPALVEVRWPGDLGPEAAGALLASAGRLRELVVAGDLQVWVPADQLRARRFPPGLPPADLVDWTTTHRAEFLFRMSSGERAPQLENLDDALVPLLAELPPPGPRTLLLRGAKLSRTSWETLAERIGSWPALERVDVRDSNLPLEVLVAIGNALPARCVFLRGGAVGGGAVEMYKDWIDWDMLYDFVHPVFDLWLADLGRLADRLGARDLRRAAEAVSARWSPAMDDHEAANDAFHAAAGLLDLLVDTAGPESAAGALLAGQRHDVGELCEGLFEGSMGNDFPYTVPPWIDGVVLLAGMVRGWRGDGADAPLWDETMAERIRAFQDTSWRRYVDGEDTEDDPEDDDE